MEEQQELAAVFGQMANKYAGDIGAAMGWGADSKEKAAIHGVIGAIQASLGGGSALAGGLAGLGSEACGQLVDDYLSSHTTLDPSEKAAITQWATALSGAAIGGVVAGNNGAQSGAAASLDAERYNRQLHPNERSEIKKLAEGDEEKEARLLAEACRRVNCAAEFALGSPEREYYEGLMQNQAATPQERAALDNYWIAQFKEAYGNYPAYPETENKQLFQYTDSDKLNDNQQFVRNQYIVQLSEVLGVEVETARQMTEGMALATLVIAAKNGKNLPGKSGAATGQLVKNSQGLQEVKVSFTPLEGQKRLNTPDFGGSGKLKPAEAATAAQLEPALGQMERYIPPKGATTGTSPDFVITAGPDKGKTVDAMYTTDKLPQKEIDGLNKFYEKNMSTGNGKIVIQDHLKKRILSQLISGCSHQTIKKSLQIT